ncbi:nitrate reductase cytochrome c-type subunit [Pyxidicoccus sp. MSG2]|uniref:nitrate reductase cytochrome c-type subunit n=1 Tax=Pyxidicoccus sp. MSG2 TaxID=2996790 RepID=UPI00226F730B|nr:nitrate reductase cytochrome c-type subunit [Pyxidicoccus sp. MSG2]MCY1022778.1 nitrate reductase cytochrome c-type subunit [Pyxidicoccus sp. MSG2]
MSGAPQGGGPGLPARWLHVAAGVAVALAFTGYVAGTRSEPERPEPVTGARSAGAPATSERAPSYRELREARRGDNARMYEGAIEVLQQGLDPLRPTAVATVEQRARAVEARRAHRAYDGAPPTIPHEVDQAGTPGCLSCHGEGMKLGERIAPRISHPPYQSCNQCHVVEVAPKPLAPYPDMPGNRFVGRASSGGGARAWPGAPPTMPHSQQMRSECVSCHGPTGRPGLRTSHPERQSCVQCHASSAVLDGREPPPGLLDSAPPPGVMMKESP